MDSAEEISVDAVIAAVLSELKTVLSWQTQLFRFTATTLLSHLPGLASLFQMLSTGSLLEGRIR